MKKKSWWQKVLSVIKVVVPIAKDAADAGIIRGTVGGELKKIDKSKL